MLPMFFRWYLKESWLVWKPVTKHRSLLLSSSSLCVLQESFCLLLFCLLLSTLYSLSIALPAYACGFLVRHTTIQDLSQSLDLLVRQSAFRCLQDLNYQASILGALHCVCLAHLVLVMFFRPLVSTYVSVGPRNHCLWLNSYIHIHTLTFYLRETYHIFSS